MCLGFHIFRSNSTGDVPESSYIEAAPKCIADPRGMVPQRGLLGAARLALRGGLRPLKLAAPICRTGLLSVRGSNRWRRIHGVAQHCQTLDQMVPQRGFEPLTHALRMRCSTN